MRVSAFNTVKKLWGKIGKDLKVGEYSLFIQNHYDTSSFQGKKYLVIQNLNHFGGNNTILAIIYILFGVICIGIALLFLMGKMGYLFQRKYKEI